VIEKIGGRDRVRTCDPLLAKQVLSQLSYTPTIEAFLILRYFRPRRNLFLCILFPRSEPRAQRSFVVWADSGLVSRWKVSRAGCRTLWSLVHQRVRV
jgi:hypothetical protein